MPVNGFFGFGFGFGFGGGVGVGFDAVGVPAVALGLGSLCPPLHAALANNAVAAIDAARAWRVRIIRDPLLMSGAV
jgi:hypothetical protein